MKYHFKVHKENTGYWAEGVEIPYARTQGDTLAELRSNMQEVLELCLDEPEDSTLILPLPDAGIKGKNILEVPVSPNMALAMLLRRQRMMARMSQRAAAEKLGIKHLSQYQRLESGKTNPELGTLARIKVMFPGLSVDMVLAQ